MAHTVVTKLQTDSRFQMALVLLAVVISLVVGLVTGMLGASGIALGLSAMVLGLFKYQRESSVSR